MISLKITKKKIKQLAKREANKLMKEWSNAVKDRDKRICVICKDAKMLNAHHIIPRENAKLRYDINNGISLCPKHHQFSRDISAHSNSFIFYVWLQENRLEQFNYIKQSVNR